MKNEKNKKGSRTKKKEGPARVYYSRPLSVTKEWSDAIDRRMAELGIRSFSEYSRMVLGNDLRNSGGGFTLMPKPPSAADQEHSPGKKW